jgi:hypothetical protein
MDSFHQFWSHWDFCLFSLAKSNRVSLVYAGVDYSSLDADWTVDVERTSDQASTEFISAKNASLV